jgi:hypothetical protein
MLCLDQYRAKHLLTTALPNQTSGKTIVAMLCVDQTSCKTTLIMDANGVRCQVAAFRLALADTVTL